MELSVDDGLGVRGIGPARGTESEAVAWITVEDLSSQAGWEIFAHCFHRCRRSPAVLGVVPEVSAGDGDCTVDSVASLKLFDGI